MKLLFWKKKPNLDYGRIEDVAVAWHLAYDEESSRAAKRQNARSQLNDIDAAQFTAVMCDDEMGMFTPEIAARIKELSKVVGVKPLPSPLSQVLPPFNASAFKATKIALPPELDVRVKSSNRINPRNESKYYANDSRNADKYERCIAISRTEKAGQVDSCILHRKHEGPHQRPSGKEWLDPIKPAPIIVFENFVFDLSDGRSIEETLKDVKVQMKQERAKLKAAQEAKLERLNRALGKLE